MPADTSAAPSCPRDDSVTLDHGAEHLLQGAAYVPALEDPQGPRDRLDGREPPVARFVSQSIHRGCFVFDRHARDVTESRDARAHLGGLTPGSVRHDQRDGAFRCREPRDRDRVRVGKRSSGRVEPSQANGATGTIHGREGWSGYSTGTRSPGARCSSAFAPRADEPPGRGACGSQCAGSTHTQRLAWTRQRGQRASALSLRLTGRRPSACP